MFYRQTASKWQKFVEGKMLETARLYGFNEIRIPVLNTPRSSAAASGGYHRCRAEGNVYLDDKGGALCNPAPRIWSPEL